MGFRLPEHSGCWYCHTDDEDGEFWWSSCEFDCVLHVRCIEIEINLQSRPDEELEIFKRELGYEL